MLYIIYLLKYNRYVNSIMSSSKDILNIPLEWPESFPNPIIGTRVLTYVFNNDPSINTFLNFVKDNFPQALLNVVEDDKGFTNVSITEIKTSEPTTTTTTTTTSTSTLDASSASCNHLTDPACKNDTKPQT